MPHSRPAIRLVALHALAACVLAALSACKQESPSTDAASTGAGSAPAAQPDAGQPAASSASAASAAPADAAGQVKAAYEKFLEVKSYRAQMSDATSGKETGTMEFVAPDRYRIRMGPAMEQVRIGSDLYTTMGNKTMHTKAEADMPDPKAAGAKMLDSIKTAKVAASGDEAVGDEPAKVYQVSLTQPMPGESKLWISERSGLPLKSETSVQGTPMRARIVYSNYDDPAIAIEAPKAQ